MKAETSTNPAIQPTSCCTITTDDDVTDAVAMPGLPAGVIAAPRRRRSLWPSVFRMVTIEWVNDFLFATDWTTYASQLLSPVQETNSQLMTSSATQLGTRAGDGVTDLIESHWLLFPIYSVAGVSVGLVVQEEINKCSSMTSNNDGQAPIARLMKYVRCDDTGEMLCICDASGGVLEVEYLWFQGTLSSMRMFSTFDARLRAYLRTCYINNTIDDTVVKASLLTSMTLKEVRASCVQCNANTATNCRCSALGLTLFRRARHPLDFPHTAVNTLPLLGDFRGHGTSMRWRNGRRYDWEHVATELRTRSGGVVGTTERLQIWAARVCFEQAKPNPLMLEMPPVGSADAVAVDKMVNGFLLSDDDDNVNDADSGQTIKYSLKVPTAKRAKIEKKEEEEEIRPLDCVVNVDDDSDSALAWKVCPTKSEISTNVPVPTNITPITIPTPIPTTIAAISATPLVPAPVAPPISIPITPVRPAPLAMSVAKLPVPLLPLPVVPNMNMNIGVNDTNYYYHNAPHNKRRWTSIAPSATPTENVQQYTSAERRKIMKREAAARSNAKRRELVALQRKLAKAKAKVEALRKREQQLRTENLQLRNRGTKVG